jgi:phage terminase small subunit
MPLTPKEQLFVSQYLIDLNGEAAAMRCGYKHKTAGNTAMRFLAKPHVQEAIAAAQSVAMVETQIKANDVLKGLAAIGFADITDYLDERGWLKPVSEWPKAGGKLIASVKMRRHKDGKGEDAKEVEVAEIKLWDKVGALDKLAKHFGLLIERAELTVEHKLATMTDAELDAFLDQTLKAGLLQAKARQVN